MPRRPNTRPTLIYWLVDTRTNTPFYCGKTVHSQSRRFSTHKREAANGANRPLHRKLRECGEQVQIHIMEIVPPNGDWVAREKRWIFLLRETNPDACNVAEGGAGPAGFVHSEATRARFRELGLNMPAETRAKIAAAHRGRKQSPEWVAKRTAGSKGRIATAETRAKLSAAHKGKTLSAAQREKIGAHFRGRKQSPELIEKRTAPRRGKKHSAESRANMSAAAVVRAQRSVRNGRGQFGS